MDKDNLISLDEEYNRQIEEDLKKINPDYTSEENDEE